MKPKTAPVIDIEIGGVPQKLFMGFRACKKLGMNPFKPEEFQAYLGDLDIDKAAKFLQAGMENAATMLKSQAPVLSVEEIIDVLDMAQFADIVQKMREAVEAGDDDADDPKEETATESAATANP